MKVNEFRPTLFLIVCVIGSSIEDDVPNDLVSVLYLKYKAALGNVSEVHTQSLRRTIKHYKEYKVHVKKLKEVNGFKTHNLLIKKEVKGDPDNPIIYINNPVETKIPNAYLTLEEFKKLLTDRVNRQTFPFMAENKHYKKYIDNNNGGETTVVKNKKKLITEYVSKKKINTEKTPNTGDSKNIENLKLTTKPSIQTQTKLSTAVITTVKHHSKTSSVQTPSLTEQGTVIDDEYEKLQTTLKEAVRLNNANVDDAPESSVFTTMEPHNTKTTDRNTDIIKENTTDPVNAADTTYADDKNTTDYETKAAEETPSEKEITTTAIKKITRSKLSRPLVFMGGFT